jgi:murein DD-endopeptidase MepM/ murein hydrolase activator NlpD
MQIGQEFKRGTESHKGKIWGGYDQEGKPILHDKKDWLKIQKQQNGPDKGNADVGKSPLDEFVEVGQKHFQETEKNTKSHNESQEKNAKKSMSVIEKIHVEIMPKIGKLHADFKIKADSTFNRLIKHVEGDNSKNLPDYFANWNKRVTGYYGEPRDTGQHWGLDIDGEQGDKLPALAGGKISEIFSDPKNLTAGGSYVKVKMPSGESYSYHHLSAITSGLKQGQEIKKGDILGQMGGEVGLPGSGKSTTGSHLHLQYYDNKGVKQDPENFMLDMGLNGYSSGTKYVPKTQIALVHKGEAIIPESLNPFVSGNQQSSSSSSINIKLTIDGNCAQNLSNLQISTFEKVAKQVFEQAIKNNLMVNPVKLRW